MQPEKTVKSNLARFARQTSVKVSGAPGTGLNRPPWLVGPGKRRAHLLPAHGDEPAPNQHQEDRTGEDGNPPRVVGMDSVRRVRGTWNSTRSPSLQARSRRANCRVPRPQGHRRRSAHPKLRSSKPGQRRRKSQRRGATARRSSSRTAPSSGNESLNRADQPFSRQRRSAG